MSSKLIYVPGDSPKPSPMPPDHSTPHQHDRLGRIEDKLDDLSSAMTQLVRMEERQIQQREDMKRLESEVDAVDKKAAAAKTLADEAKAKIDTWVNRGIGLWGGAMALWAIANSKVFLALIGQG